MFPVDVLLNNDVVYLHAGFSRHLHTSTKLVFPAHKLPLKVT